MGSPLKPWMRCGRSSGEDSSPTIRSTRCARTCARPSDRDDRAARAFRSRRIVPPAAEGRWTTIARPTNRSLTEWATAFTEQLLTRHGVVTREITAIEQIPGGFSAIYPVLRRLEETGRVRRGYFVMGLGAAQFAQPGAVDLLRAGRDETDEPQVVTLAATDPANPYGAVVPWPDWVAPDTTDPGSRRSAQRATRRPLRRRSRGSRRRTTDGLDCARRSFAAGVATCRRSGPITRGALFGARARGAGPSRARGRTRLAHRRDQRHRGRIGSRRALPARRGVCRHRHGPAATRPPAAVILVSFPADRACPPMTGTGPVTELWQFLRGCGR